MGLLEAGSPLTWEQAQPYLDHVRKHGLAQFVHTYNQLKGRTNDEFLWGDEVCDESTLRTLSC
jgi:glutamate--cysteine ligase catalytic subunit